MHTCEHVRSGDEVAFASEAFVTQFTTIDSRVLVTSPTEKGAAANLLSLSVVSICNFATRMTKLSNAIQWSSLPVCFNFTRDNARVIVSCRFRITRQIWAYAASIAMSNTEASTRPAASSCLASSGIVWYYAS